MPYPPRWNTALAPTWPPAVTASASVLYAPSRRLTHAANWAAWSATRLGLGVLSWHRREPWTPPMGEETFAQMMDEWTVVCGEAITGFVVYRRLQAERAHGAAVMLRTRRGGAFVKVTRGDTAELDTEVAFASATRYEGCPFRIPEVLASGSTHGWRWTATRPISLRPHAPVLDPDIAGDITDDITRLVESTIDRPTGVPQHWTGSHGDLTPWNLRRVGRSTKPWLIDWSDAGWRPPGADRLYYRAVVAAVSGKWSGPAAVAAGEEEAAEHWASVQAERKPAAGEQRLHDRLVATFDQVR